MEAASLRMFRSEFFALKNPTRGAFGRIGLGSWGFCDEDVTMSETGLLCFIRDVIEAQCGMLLCFVL